MALAADYQRSALGDHLRMGAYPVLATENIHAGALVTVDAAGFAKAATDTAGEVVVGVARKGFDNTLGANGVLSHLGSARFVECDEGRAYSFKCAGSPVAGATVWIVDDDNVTTVAGNVTAGRLVQPDPLGGSTAWFVAINKTGGV